MPTLLDHLTSILEELGQDRLATGSHIRRRLEERGFTEFDPDAIRACLSEIASRRPVVIAFTQDGDVLTSAVAMAANIQSLPSTALFLHRPTPNQEVTG